MLSRLTPSRLVGALLISQVACTPAAKPALNDTDVQEIRSAMTNYREAWKRGDSSGVLARVADDLILFMPTRDGKPIVGRAAVANFWFPASGTSYPITRYDISNDDIGGSGAFAYYQGISTLSWKTVANGVATDSSTAVSEFTTLLRKENGQWKIFRQMYNLKDTSYTRP